VLRAEGIGKRFGAVTALQDVSFALPRGTMTIISGADGAGKSTLLKILVGLVRRDQGLLVLHDREIGSDFTPVTSICGYMPERFSLYTDLTVEENLDFFAAIHQVPVARLREMKTRMLEKTGMAPFRDRRAGALSGGMKQKLALSVILLSSPDLILLDEPTTGVDPLSRIEFFDILQELKAEGKTIALTTPYLDEAEKGDYVIFLKEGQVLAQDSIRSLLDRFPARLLRIVPRESIFAAMEELEQNPLMRGRAYMRGNAIHILQLKGESWAPPFPVDAIGEEPPSLEDIFIYYERQLARGESS